jgi:prefoldin subunit 5
MSERNLEESLKELQGRLADVDTVTEQREQRLQAVNEQIDQILDPERESEYEQLRERLNEAIADFQEDHPQLVVAFRDIVTALSNMGI